jgi:hypothetical protein
MAYKFTPEDEKFLSRTWEEWVKGERLGKYKLGMNYLEFRHLYKIFLDTCEKSGIGSTSKIPPYWGEIWDETIDKTLSKQENEARIEAEVNKLMPSPMEIEAGVEENKIDAEMLRYLETMAHDLGKQIVDKEMAEKVSVLEATISELNEEKRRRRLAERELEQAVKTVRDLKDTLAKKEAELKTRPPTQVSTFRVLRDFKEYLTTYKTGTILKFSNSEDVEWAKRKVAEGYLEETPSVSPVKIVVPPTKPKTLAEEVDEAIKELRVL